MIFIAKRSGTCGHCAKPISAGQSIVKIKPHRVEKPGRYDDPFRPYVVIVHYGHTECAEKVRVK